jgi:hypothetical protein
MLPVLRSNIDLLNQAEAATFDAINSRYRTFRIPRPFPIYLNLTGFSGNLSVFYSLSGVETFQPYVMINETPQPFPSSLQTTQAASVPGGAPAPGGGGTNPAAAPASSAASPSPPAAPSEYYGNFQVHHFDQGTIFGSFAFNSLSNPSFSVVPSGYSGTANYVISRSSPRVGIAVLVGVELYFRSQDEYPGAGRRLFRGWGAMFGASVFPLNQYFIGPSVEPKRGFMLGAGYVIGSQPSLPSSTYVGQSLGPTTTATGTAITAPALSTNSVFKSGFFFTVGFDINIFQAIFGKVNNVGTPSAPSAGASPGK